MFSFLYFFALFIFGSAIGSFLNVISLRYSPKRSVFALKPIRGRSHCPHCKKNLRWFELVPILSFFVQKGRCRRCRHKLSWQYPVVELLTGAVFVLVPLFFRGFYGGAGFVGTNIFYALVTLWVLVFLVWILISIIDRRHYIVPNELNIFLAIIGFFIVAININLADVITPFHSSFLKQYIMLFSPSGSIWLNHLLGAFAGSIFFIFLIMVSRGRAMGWGDVKLMLVSGFILGWPDVGLSLMIAFVIGGAWGLILLLKKQKKMKDRLPFAPFLIVGMVLTIFIGHSLVEGYFGLFGI